MNALVIYKKKKEDILGIFILYSGAIMFIIRKKIIK